MKKVTIKNNNETWIFGVDRLKVIMDFNHSTTYSMLKTIEFCMSKSSPSEYQEENQIKQFLEFDDCKIDKSYRLIKVNLWDNFSDNIKLLSKTLMLEYLESCLLNVEIEDSFALLKSYLNQFSEEVLRGFAINFELACINFRINDLTSKMLLKFINAELLLDEISADDIDLSLEEKSMIFIKMIESIASKTSEKTYIVIFDHLLLNSRIICQMRNSMTNLHFLVLANCSLAGVNLDEVFVSARANLDLGIEEDVYQKCVVEYGLEPDMQNLELKLKALFANSKHPVIDLANLFYPII